MEMVVAPDWRSGVWDVRFLILGPLTGVINIQVLTSTFANYKIGVSLFYYCLVHRDSMNTDETLNVKYSNYINYIIT